MSRCCGRRRQWQAILPDSQNQKVLTDWPTSSPAASEAWPLTCLLPRRAYDCLAEWTSWTATGRPTDDVCSLSIRGEDEGEGVGRGGCRGGWVGEEGCQQGWNNMITHLVSSWYLIPTTPHSLRKHAGDFIYQITNQVALKMVNYGKPVLFFPLNCTLIPKKMWIISLVTSQATRLVLTAHRLGKIAERSTKPLRINE